MELWKIFILTFNLLLNGLPINTESGKFLDKFVYLKFSKII